MNQPRNPEHTINNESQRLKTVKKLDSKLKKTAARQALKSLNWQENITKMKNLQNYDSEVQMYTQTYSELRLAN